MAELNCSTLTIHHNKLTIDPFLSELSEGSHDNDDTSYIEDPLNNESELIGDEEEGLYNYTMNS